MRRGPLPSLAELGAFDGVSPASAPRRSGRLTEEDLRGLSGPQGAQSRLPTQGKPADPLARPKAGRSWHADTPFETVQTPEGVQLRKEAEARAQAQARAAEQARAAARQAEVARRAEALARSEKAAPPAALVPAEPQASSRGIGEESPIQGSGPEGPSAAGLQSAPGTGPGGARRTVPAVNVAWGDLNAAVQAGWIRPEAAHALWARWLARKPLTHMEDDGQPQAPLPPLPGASPPPAPAAEAIPPGPAGETPAGDAGAAPSRGVPADREEVGATPAGPSVERSRSRDEVLDADHPDLTARSSDAQSARADTDIAEPEPSPAPRKAAPAAAPDPATTAEDAASASSPSPSPAPEVVEVEVLEPLQDANARRTAELAFQPPPVIQVTDVIEALPDKPAPAPEQAPGWIVGQYVITLLAAAVTAVSVGLGHVLFGPAGAALAAAVWTVVVWRKTSRFHALGQGLRAVLGAHLVLPLLALTVWQIQEAAGWWPAARPLDLFADAPMDTLARAAPGLRLDWRWLALGGMPLVAAVVWLIRLRRPVMLGAVTALLWLVTFQAVAGVLEALGLAFHGMTVFMLLLGALTLLGAFYIDLKSRAAAVADFARWPYWCGAVLLGAGWLSLSVVPGPLVALRYAAWFVFVAWALSLARPSLVALALAMAGFEAAFMLAKVLGSDLIAGTVWLVWLAVTGAVLAWMLPRAPRWAPRWQFWMPKAWRRALLAEPSATGPQG